MEKLKVLLGLLEKMVEDIKNINTRMKGLIESIPGCAFFSTLLPFSVWYSFSFYGERINDYNLSSYYGDIVSSGVFASTGLIFILMNSWNHLNRRHVWSGITGAVFSVLWMPFCWLVSFRLIHETLVEPIKAQIDKLQIMDIDSTWVPAYFAAYFIMAMGMTLVVDVIVDQFNTKDQELKV